MLSDLRYSARSLARTPGVAVALVLTIAVGIGSNAVVSGFVGGLLARRLPLKQTDAVVSIVRLAEDGTSGPVSSDDYRSISGASVLFEWVGAVRESLAVVDVGARTTIRPAAAITSEVAALFQLSLADGIVVSQRLRRDEWTPATEVSGEALRIDGVEARVGGLSPDWLDGLYEGRPVDLWTPLNEASLDDAERASRRIWTIARLRAGVTIDRAEIQLNTERGDAGPLRVIAYTGLTPDLADGLARVGLLLRAAAAAVFCIAGVNVACLLLSRAWARSRETSVRVALGASRRQLARQLLADSVLISMVGGAFGLLFAMWTADVVPSLFFDKDASQLIFAADRTGILAASIACVGITIVCGLMPLIVTRDDRPAAVLRRESAGPSTAMRRVRMGLVAAQMALCCVLVVSAGLLIASFRSALQTNVGRRLGTPVLATMQARPAASRAETASTGLDFFRAVEETAQSVAGISPRAWIATLPGGLPAWQRFRVEPSMVSARAQTLDVALFTPASLARLIVPPVNGRLFGGQDRARACRVAIVNEAAARDLFDGDAVGRSIDDPSGQPVEIVGVVAERLSEPAQATIYYYADQAGLPVAPAGAARFRVPVDALRTNAALESNIVSASYFAAMGWTLESGRLFADDLLPGCRVGVVNQEAAAAYFAGHAVGAAVIDQAGQRTQIIGVIRAAPLRTLQRRVEPAIYFPMAQDFLTGMTLILNARDASDAVLRNLRRRIELVPGRGPAPVVVRTLDSHLRQTALAPLRIATTLVEASAVTALLLGVLGLWGAMSDSAQRRRREIAVRVALGATGWRVIRQIVSEGAGLAAVGLVAGLAGSIPVADTLARITTFDTQAAVWVWLAAPLILLGSVAVASVLPARRALAVDPMSIARADQ